MDHETPSYRTFSYFITNVLGSSIEDIFYDINRALFEKEQVDLRHIYIDGSKFEANANKYSWVWKKAAEKSRYRLFDKITTLLGEINASLSWSGIRIRTNTEYVPRQRQYETLKEYMEKLKEYTEKIRICGDDRNSYSKTDHSATFMRIKKDYMGNGQLLPAYNVQFGVADEYIAIADINQYRSDMDCFIPLLEQFYAKYGFYPRHPVADAGYGSYTNYIYCQQHGMEKYMKFPMFCCSAN